MLIAFRDDHVRAAAAPTAVVALNADAASDVATAMTVLAHARTLADLLGLRSLVLSHLSKSPSVYFLGTHCGGVTFRPIDQRGRVVPTTHTKESLMKITAVSIQAIGRAQKKTLAG